MDELGPDISEVFDVPEVSNVDESNEMNFNKFNVKALRDMLTTKGVKTNGKMKKNELVRLVSNKTSLIVDLAFEPDDSDVLKPTELIAVPLNELDKETPELMDGDDTGADEILELSISEL